MIKKDRSDYFLSDPADFIFIRKTVLKSEKLVRVRATPKRKSHYRHVKGAQEVIREQSKEQSISDMMESSSGPISDLLGKPENSEMAESIRDYTIDEYVDVNSYLRTGKVSGIVPDFVLDKSIVNISKFLSDPSIPKVNGMVYRGMTFSKDAAGEKKLDVFMKGVEVGEEIILKPFTSTSASKEIAETNFIRPVKTTIIFTIKSKNGVYLNGASHFGLEHEKSEHEVLFDKNTRFSIKSITTDDKGVIRISMDEIGNQELVKMIRSNTIEIDLSKLRLICQKQFVISA